MDIEKNASVKSMAAIYIFVRTDNFEGIIDG